MTVGADCFGCGPPCAMGPMSTSICGRMVLPRSRSCISAQIIEAAVMRNTRKPSEYASEVAPLEGSTW